jgi:hypothetical protein
MNESTKNALEGAAVTVERAKSGFWVPRPQIEVRLPRGAHHRRLLAALHLLAAEAEAATPQGEEWCVQMEATSDERGIVYLELLTGSEGEAERGLALMRAIAG